MAWPVFWSVIVLLGLTGLVSSISGIRFERASMREGRELWNASRQESRLPETLQQREDLPAPVRRWLTSALGGRTTAPARAFVSHEGRFQPSANGRTLPIEGKQWFTADPPGFVWWGRVRVSPGLWIDARDGFAEGHGRMTIRGESLIPFGDVTGREIDQSAALRLLGELAFVPAAFLDRRYVTWTAVDDESARATLTSQTGSVEATFEFDSEGLPAVFRCERYRAVGDASELTPFVGKTADWRRVDGILVPFRIEGTWMIDGRPFTFARWEVREVRFDDGTSSNRVTRAMASVPSGAALPATQP